MNAPAIKGWKYRIYPGDLPAAQFGCFESLVVLWRSKIQNGNYPTWRDFKFEEFEQWWGRLSLADIRNDPLDLEFILWGTKLTDWWGIDFTKKKMSMSYERRQENWEHYEGQYFRSLIDHGGIGMVGGTLIILDRDFVTVQGIDLLLMKDGKISQILSGYVNLDSAQPKLPKTDPIIDI